MPLTALHRGPFARGVSLLTLVAFTVAGSDCVFHRWRAVPITQMTLDREHVVSRDLRLFTTTGDLTMRVSAFDFPYVTGSATTSTQAVVQFDVSLASAAEFETTDNLGTIRSGAAPTLVAIKSDPSVLLGRTVRFRTDRGTVVLRGISRVEAPWVEGQLVDGKGPVRIDLDKVERLQIFEVNVEKTVLVDIVAPGAIVATVALLVALLKESCPFVYVYRGHAWELVGEAYAGAAFQSVQRDDLLPVPSVGATRRVAIRLRNEARETQYTDRAELVIVDHEPGLRALSTFDGHPVLVGPSRSATWARDGRGVDVAALVSASDARVWETDPAAAALVEQEPLDDVLTSGFALPITGAPMLEITASNTPWLDLTFGRFFAAMGDHLDEYIAAGNRPSAERSIRHWREREGIDLLVEMRAGDTWKLVAVVPTIGPAALREVAVPLPVDRAHGTDRVQVRLRSGLGFWRVDRLALSASDGAPVEIRHVKARAARATGGRDDLATIAATDQRYNALAEFGESLDLDFDLPPLRVGRTRDTFLFSSGYYNVHPPVQAAFQPGILMSISDQPGAFARFGRDLAREYVRLLALRSQSARPAGSHR